jgi:hypothetical protein
VKKIAGSWLEDKNSPPLGAFWSYTFNADGTYTGRGGCRPDGDGPHCFAISATSGKWTIAKSGPQLGAPGGVPELVLVDSLNQKETFFYTLDGNTLKLSTAFRGQESTFERQP